MFGRALRDRNATTRPSGGGHVFSQFHPNQCNQPAFREFANSDYRRGYRYSTNALVHTVTVQTVMSYVATSKLGSAHLWPHVVLFWGDRPLDPAARMIDVIDGRCPDRGSMWIQGRIPCNNIKRDGRPPPNGEDGLPEVRLHGPTRTYLTKAAANASTGDQLAAATVLGPTAMSTLLELRDADPYGLAQPRAPTTRAPRNARAARGTSQRRDQRTRARPTRPVHLVPAAHLQRTAQRSASRSPMPRHGSPSPTSSSAGPSAPRPATDGPWANFTPTTRRLLPVK